LGSVARQALPAAMAVGLRRAPTQGVRLAPLSAIEASLDYTAVGKMRADLARLECPWCGASLTEDGRGEWHGPVLEVVCADCGVMLRVFVGPESIELDEPAIQVHPSFPND